MSSQKVTATFSRDCKLHLSFVIVTSMSFLSWNQPCPPSLTARWKVKLGTKSDIVRCLEDVTEKQHDVTPSVEIVVLDGSAMLCVLKPTAAGTFRDYAQYVFVPCVEDQLGKGHRIDVVWDNHRPDSLKAQTWDTRGK